MNPDIQSALVLSDWLALFGHYLTLSLMSIGGAITAAPEMHRYLVEQQHWLSESQFAASVALAQAAPGPNVLFVALMGWHVGINAGGILTALLGALISMFGILLPSTTLVHWAAGWGHRNRTLRSVRAFKQGMAPIVVALLMATGWIIASAHGDLAVDWRLWLVTTAMALIIWRTKLHLLWLLAAGALLGSLGFL
jgi:chromate transporter